MYLAEIRTRRPVPRMNNATVYRFNPDAGRVRAAQQAQLLRSIPKPTRTTRANAVKSRVRNALGDYDGGLGFNPLKAIGRALGSTGRALTAAIPVIGPAISGTLEVAARQPADKQGNAPQTANVVPPTDANVIPGSASSTDALMQAALVKMLTQQGASVPQYAPAPSPTAPTIYYPPAPQAASAPQQGGMPSWVVPAAIGGAALLILTMRK